jgi:hypothetical protein
MTGANQEARFWQSRPLELQPRWLVDQGGKSGLLQVIFMPLARGKP